MPEVYKVCAARRGQLTSIIGSNLGHCLTYRMSEWVEAPIGGLFCFPSLEDAQYFADISRHEPGGVVILRCLAEEEVPTLPAELYEWDDDDIRRSWVTDGPPQLLPKGTALFKRLVPIERVRSVK